MCAAIVNEDPNARVSLTLSTICIVVDHHPRDDVVVSEKRIAYMEEEVMLANEIENAICRYMG